MKAKMISSLLATPVVLLAMTAHAHDPNEHMTEAEKPDCGMMEKMDNSKKDMNDPVMQAMMEKCSGMMNSHEMSDDELAEKNGAHDHESTSDADHHGAALPVTPMADGHTDHQDY
ncbi:hypothetical protein [Alloalcanivorax xenomutans]|uniref:hypothetical protein n=1 Tax=Alloalcanivorax xenomutans TaxID=1094342 RepID=UPI003BAA384A